MSDAKRLLAEATPLPWRDDGYMDYGHTDTFGCHIKAGESGDYAVSVTHAGHEGLEGSVPNPADAALIVYAVNNLPVYEAAVDALERLWRNLLDSSAHPDAYWSERQAAEGQAYAALRRLGKGELG